VPDRRPRRARRRGHHGAALDGGLVRADLDPDVHPDGRVRDPERRRRRPVPRRLDLGRPRPGRPRHGDGARRRRLRRDLGVEHRLGGDALVDDDAGDAQGGLRPQARRRRGRDLGDAGDADPAEHCARALRDHRRRQHRPAPHRRRDPRHPGDADNHGDGLGAGDDRPKRGAARQRLHDGREVPLAQGRRADDRPLHDGHRRHLLRRRHADRGVGPRRVRRLRAGHPRRQGQPGDARQGAHARGARELHDHHDRRLRQGLRLLPHADAVDAGDRAVGRLAAGVALGDPRLHPVRLHRPRLPYGPGRDPDPDRADRPAADQGARLRSGLVRRHRHRRRRGRSSHAAGRAQRLRRLALREAAAAGDLCRRLAACLQPPAAARRARRVSFHHPLAPGPDGSSRSSSRRTRSSPESPSRT